MFDERTGVRRDARIIALIGAAHSVSHFLQLALPPLFPLLKDELDASYAALGLVMSVFFGASGIGQTVSGFLVDRVGPKPVLVGGLLLFGGATALTGLVTSYWMLLPAALLAGLGNSVFHPSDYTAFNTLIDRRRLGRAFSVHSISGNLGWAIAPAFVGAITAAASWRVALVAAGSTAIAMALVPVLFDRDIGHRVDADAAGAATPAGIPGGVRLLLAPPIVMAFAYFTLLAMAWVGLQTFGVPTIVALYGAPLGAAAGALTGFLLGNSAGTLGGGFVADRTTRHDVVAVVGMMVATVITIGMATASLPVSLLPLAMFVAGACLGLTGPSRDMLVRSATPRGASGRVYGFVYSGLDLGSSTTPLLFGWLLDHGEPRMVFLVTAALMVLTAMTVLQVRRRTAPLEVRA